MARISKAEKHFTEPAPEENDAQIAYGVLDNETQMFYGFFTDTDYFAMEYVHTYLDDVVANFEDNPDELADWFVPSSDPGIVGVM